MSDLYFPFPPPFRMAIATVWPRVLEVEGRSAGVGVRIFGRGWLQLVGLAGETWVVSFSFEPFAASD